MELNPRLPEKNNIKIFKTEKYWMHTNFGKLLDTNLGNTSFIYGFDNAIIKNKMKEVQDTIAYLNQKHNETCDYVDDLNNKILKLGNYDAVSWAVSGSDGVECAIYINDLYYKQLGIDKSKIITFYPGYNGTTYLLRSMRKDEYNDKFIILNRSTSSTADQRHRQDNILLEQVKNLLNTNKNIGAIMFETLPWYKGIAPWGKEFWVQLREICNNYDINLILDDVFGCAGKLGPFFSQDRFNVKADICVLGKALTGGYSPLSCACTTNKIADVIKEKFLFGHTWQPNMAGVGAALAVIELHKIFKADSIEIKLNELGKKLVNKGVLRKYENQGIFLAGTFWESLPQDAFVDNGLSGWGDLQHSLGIIAPLIADDEYFFELETRIMKCLKPKKRTDFEWKYKPKS